MVPDQPQPPPEGAFRLAECGCSRTILVVFIISPCSLTKSVDVKVGRTGDMPQGRLQDEKQRGPWQPT